MNHFLPNYGETKTDFNFNSVRSSIYILISFELKFIRAIRCVASFSQSKV